MNFVIHIPPYKTSLCVNRTIVNSFSANLPIINSQKSVLNPKQLLAIASILIPGAGVMLLLSSTDMFGILRIPPFVNHKGKDINSDWLADQWDERSGLGHA